MNNYDISLTQQIGCNNQTKQSIHCLRCDNKFCAKCSNLTANEIKIFQSHKTVFSACDPWSYIAFEAIKNEKEIADRYKDMFDSYSKSLNGQIRGLTDELDEICSEVTDVKSRVETLETNPTKESKVDHLTIIKKYRKEKKEN